MNEKTPATYAIAFGCERPGGTGATVRVLHVTGARMHALEHSSVSSELPSSHCSPGLMTPSPHRGAASAGVASTVASGAGASIVDDGASMPGASMPGDVARNAELREVVNRSHGGVAGVDRGRAWRGQRRDHRAFVARSAADYQFGRGPRYRNARLRRVLVARQRSAQSGCSDRHCEQHTDRSCVTIEPCLPPATRANNRSPIARCSVPIAERPRRAIRTPIS